MFKVGDRVRVRTNNPSYSNLFAGQEVTVCEVHERGVITDCGWGVLFKDIELIQPKVGDRVRMLIDDWDIGDETYFKGDVFQVLKVDDENVWFNDRSGDFVRMLDFASVELTTDPVYVAKPSVEHIVVALTSTGALAPATRPFVHPTRDAAETEAARLAVANPGQRFAVFVRLSTTVAEVAPVKTIAA